MHRVGVEVGTTGRIVRRQEDDDQQYDQHRRDIHVLREPGLQVRVAEAVDIVDVHGLRIVRLHRGIK